MSPLTARLTGTPESAARQARINPMQRLGQPDDIAALIAFLLSPDALPNLQAFMGSRRLAPIIVPRRPVSQVTLAWHARNVELEVNCVIPPLALTSISIRSLNCATPGWSSPLIRAIAIYLPKLHRLRLHNISADVNNEYVRFVIFSSPAKFLLSRTCLGNL